MSPNLPGEDKDVNLRSRRSAFIGSVLAAALWATAAGGVSGEPGNGAYVNNQTSCGVTIPHDTLPGGIGPIDFGGLLFDSFPVTDSSATVIVSSSGNYMASCHATLPAESVPSQAIVIDFIIPKTSGPSDFVRYCHAAIAPSGRINYVCTGDVTPA